MKKNKWKGLTIGLTRTLWWISIAGTYMMGVAFNSVPAYVLTGIAIAGIVIVELAIIQKMLGGLQYLVSDDYKFRDQMVKVAGVSDQKPLNN